MRTEVTEMERASTLARKTQHKVKNGLRLAVTYLFLGLLGLVMSKRIATALAICVAAIIYVFALF